MTQNLQSYFKCSAFESKKPSGSSGWKADTRAPANHFWVEQQELVLEQILEDGRHKYSSEMIKYDCWWTQGPRWDKISPVGDGGKVCAIIPIREDDKLLNYTLSNLQEHGILDLINVIVVDDRSSTENVQKVTEEFGCSYLKVVNDKGFNFSMLCNIATWLVNSFEEHSEVIMWNSDLWASDAKTVPELIRRHRQTGAKITGTKLVYPPFSWDGSEEKSNNMEISFKKLDFEPGGTVQFGGGTILAAPNGVIMPEHFGRFQSPELNAVNSDTLTPWVTGAFQIIDLEWFIREGGFNPSLSKAYQDVDLCLRAVLQDEKILYAGHDLKLYHDESLQHCQSTDKNTSLEDIQKSKFDHQFASDMHLFSRVWVPNVHYIMTRDRRIPIKPTGEL